LVRGWNECERSGTFYEEVCEWWESVYLAIEGQRARAQALYYLINM